MREKEAERKEQTSTKVDEAALETRQQTVLTHGRGLGLIVR